jgi:general secretion pathway protein K
MDSLHDWIDEDDLKRLNGAEKYYYHNEQAYAYLPRNDKFIQSLDELLLIKGMPGKIFELLKSEILETTPAAININTASAPVLAAAANIDLENARRFLQVRDKKGEVSLNDLLVATGKKLTFEDDYVTAFPSLTLDVDIRTRVNEAGDKVRLLVRFTPDRERPYTVEKFDQ